MHCIIRTTRFACVVLSCTGLSFIGQNSVQHAHAADVRAEIQQYRLAHEAAIVGEIDALTRLKSVAADPAGIIATAEGGKGAELTIDTV